MIIDTMNFLCIYMKITPMQKDSKGFSPALISIGKQNVITDGTSHQPWYIWEGY